MCRYIRVMSKPQIFVSCGQRTSQEKQLAGEICKAIKDHGAFDVFFAEFQHSLHGLNENILDALARTTGFVTVLHRRGNVSYHEKDSIALVRASVWVEQEIAIAAFIQRTEKRQLLTAAYIEEGVGREGIRELLHLNPAVFKTNDDVIVDLKDRLSMWQAPDTKSSSEDEYGKLDLRHHPRFEAPVGRVVRLAPILTNKGSRAKEYACSLDVPSPLLSWNTSSYYVEAQGAKAGYRRFRVTEVTKQNAPILKDQTMEMLGLDVSITHLSEPSRSEVLKLPIVLSAELESHSYELTVTCDEVFREPVPSL
jgi:hypothetical protein